MKSILLAVVLATAIAEGATLSFQGNFSLDDDVVLIPFVSAGGLVSIRTWGYAGGLNTNADLIARGGFDPAVAVFELNGLLLALNDNGAAVDADPPPGTGFAWDAEITFPLLPAGTYTLALTQANNFAAGPFLADGFARAGEGNFTGADLGIPGGSFLDISGDQRDSHWAVDITGAEVPEPSGLWFVLAGTALSVCLRKWRKP